MQFIRKLRRAQSDVWTSPAVIQETLYGFLREAIRSAAPLDSGGRPLQWGAFKREDPEAFNEAFRAHAPVIATGLKRFVRTEGIAIRLPRVGRRRARAGEALYGMMRHLLRRHVIEPADAMHYASAWLDGTSAILTNDAGFQEIDGAEVYASL
jgi:predicted nucleic acid-binding protein